MLADIHAELEVSPCQFPVSEHDCPQICIKDLLLRDFQFIPLPGVGVTHTICAACFTGVIIQLGRMPSPKSPEWSQLLREGNWEIAGTEKGFPIYWREVGGIEQLVKMVWSQSMLGGAEWVLFVNETERFAGDLTPCLEAANVTPV